MGLIFGIIKRFIKLLLYFLIFAAIIILIPNLPPYTSFSSIKLQPLKPSVGPLALNGALNNHEPLYKGKLLGPEAFQLYNGEIYTSLATGEIVKLSQGGHVTFVTKIGQPCEGLTQEHICGRPLGFEIDEKNNLMYVADAYHGIWKVDLKTDKKQLLVSPRVEISGRKPKLFNTVALAKNGDLYWTDSTSDFLLKDGAYSLMADPSGRLFYYNAAKNESKVLLDNIWFANGLAVSPDNQFLVLAETNGCRLLKYYINGPKKGKSEIFVDGLPGTPDNLRALPDGSGVLVALYTVFDENEPFLMKTLAEAPLARKFLARVMRLIEIPFEFLYQQYPHVLFDEIVYYIGHFRSLAPVSSGTSAITTLDWDGNIVASYYSTDGKLKAISDAIVFNDKLYMGAAHKQDYVATVPAPPLLKKAFAKKPEIKEVPKQTKPIEQPQKIQEAPRIVEKPLPPKVHEEKMPPKVEEKKPTKAEEKKPTKVEEKKTKQKVVVEKKIPPKVEEKKVPPKVEEKKLPPKVEEKKSASKVEEKKEVPKERLASQTPPKPTAAPPKPTEHSKTTTSRPEGKNSETTGVPKTTKPAPKTERKPTQNPEPKVAAKPTEQVKKPNDKPNEKPKTELPAANNIQQDSNSKKPRSESPKVDSAKADSGKAGPEHIPIEEEIPSDTLKPNRETLKVIKKGGPTEIPNPNL